MKIAVKHPDGRILATYQVFKAELNPQRRLTEEDAFEEAKRNAIEDGFVTENEADDLSFEVVG